MADRKITYRIPGRLVEMIAHSLEGLYLASLTPDCPGHDQAYGGFLYAFRRLLRVAFDEDYMPTGYYAENKIVDFVESRYFDTHEGFDGLARMLKDEGIDVEIVNDRDDNGNLIDLWMWN